MIPFREENRIMGLRDGRMHDIERERERETERERERENMYVV